MTTIRRFNTVLTVNDSEVDYYVNLGYDVIDDKGNVVRKSMSNDVKTLQHELRDSWNEVAKLEKEIAELKAVISELQAGEKLKTTKKKAAE